MYFILKGFIKKIISCLDCLEHIKPLEIIEKLNVLNCIFFFFHNVIGWSERSNNFIMMFILDSKWSELSIYDTSGTLNFIQKLHPAIYRLKIACQKYFEGSFFLSSIVSTDVKKNCL